MQAIPTTINGERVYSKPLTFGQLEDNEAELKSMFVDANALQQSGSFDPSSSIPLLKRQLDIIGLGMKNFNPKFKPARLRDMSMQEIAINFQRVVSGSGLVEVDAEKLEPVTTA